MQRHRMTIPAQLTLRCMTLGNPLESSYTLLTSPQWSSHINGRFRGSLPAVHMDEEKILTASTLTTIVSDNCAPFWFLLYSYNPSHSCKNKLIKLIFFLTVPSSTSSTIPMPQLGLHPSPPLLLYYDVVSNTVIHITPPFLFIYLFIISNRIP